MLGWISYVLVVSLLLGCAALACERAARLRKLSTRWLWVTSIVASLLLPLAMSSVSVRLPSIIAPGRDAAAPVIALRQIAARELSPAVWLSAGAGPAASSPRLDGALKGLWLAASLALSLLIALSSLRLSRAQRHWARCEMAGATVLVAADLGPAIVGLVHPRIVVPQWLTAASPEQQHLVIAHEQAHLDGHDARLLMVALGLLICMPWNLPLWWQLRRLRFAIELDCDARVLARGHDIRRYGEALIAVGERQSAGLAVVAAMSESKSFLEQRIGHMLRKKTRRTLIGAAALGGFGLCLAAAAAQVAPPDIASLPTPGANAMRKEITLDPATLDRYVGFYQLNDGAVFTVERAADHLLIQLTGQGKVPVFAETGTDFFSKVINVQFTFVTDAGGAATSLILHQGGGNMPAPRIDAAQAEQIAAHTAERMKSQSANPLSAAAVARLVASVLDGKPNYDEMSSGLAEATRHQLPQLQSNLSKLGPVKAITFVGVGNHGEDVYNVRHENGASTWRLALDAKGIITIALVRLGA